jgi:hypothetical protein
MKTLYKVAIVVLTLAMVGSLARSGQKTWDAGDDGKKWSKNNNWNPNGVPSATDTVVIGSGFTPQVDIDAVCAALTIGSGTTLTFTTDNKSLRVGLSTGGGVTNNGTISWPSGTIGVTFRSMGNFVNNGPFTIAGTDSLIVEGNFTNSSSDLSISNSGMNFILKGDWTNTGSLGTTWMSNGTIIVNGTSNQTFTGSRFLNLTVNKPSGNVISGSDHEISGTLTLTSGKWVLGVYNLTLDNSGATISGGSSGSYIVTNDTGKLIIFGVNRLQGYRDFPVGPSTTAGDYNPLSIKTNSTSDDSFRVRVIGSVDPTSADDSKAVQRTWDITKSGPSTNDSLKFQWKGSDEGANFSASRALAVCWKHNGTAWIEFGSMVGAITGTDPYVATVGGITSFSHFTIGLPGALPIQLASFSASVIRDRDVEVAWKTVSETNNYGFEVYRKRGESGDWTKVGFVEGHGTTLTPQSYSYVDRGVAFGKYYYRIKQMDLDGKSETFPEMEVTVGVAPDKVVLAQNYPNPFNPSTIIEFVVPENGFATLKVYNILGQEVASLFEGNAEAGKVYNARFNASSLPSGIYFYSLRSAGKVETKRMILTK